MIDGGSVHSLGSRHNQHSFAQVPDVYIPRSAFNRSFAVKDTMDFDYLNPIFVDEILPGDTINLNVNSFIRLANQQVPVLDNMYVDYFFFFVPNRLVWDNWEKFMGSQDNPADSTDYQIPVVTAPVGGWDAGTIYDKLGIPINIQKDINALPLRGLNLIYNEWFRDQNLVDSLTINTGDGPDTSTDYTLQKRAKNHDYFTSCLPWPQKNNDATLDVSLPLGTSAPITRSSNAAGWVAYQQGTDILAPNATVDTTSGNLESGTTRISLDPNNGLVADLSNATSATINQFRQSILIQSLLELDARGGTRYVEMVRAHFNVQVPDYRAQRPELLSVGSTRISQHPVPQTSETGTTPQGNLAAFSTASTSGKIGFSKSFVEHGYVFGMAAARADVTFQQGLHKMWTRQDRLDFFFPKLQGLGEQPVYLKEIYLQGTTDDDNVFGYQENYAEYRYKPSEIRGQFKSTYSSSLDVWHLAEEFSTAPSLNQAFIESNTPIERVLTTAASYPHLLADFWFDMNHVRPMSVYGVPATLGRF